MKKIISTVFVLLGLTFLITPVSFADGEATYAVIQNGVVVNSIVCQPSVCEGQWGGKMPNDTPWPGAPLVLQVPANPVTGKNQGGFFNPPPQPGEPDRQVYYDSNSKTFSQKTDTPQIVEKTTVDNGATINTKVAFDLWTFTPDNVINSDGKIQGQLVSTSTTSATLSATQQTSTGTVSNTLTFSSPKTEQQVEEAAVYTPLISSRLRRFFDLLSGWVL